MNRRHSVVLLIEHNPQLLALNGLVLREPGFRLVEMLWEVALKNTVLYDEAIKHAEEAEADRQRLRRFLAMVAHDLRGPLTVVLGYTQMQRLVVDLLDTARSGVGHFEIHPEHIDLMTVLRFVVEEQQATTTDHCITLEEPDHTKGSGLGLYIAKGIVDAHHGRIWVNSELGHGSVFCVALPRFYS